MGCNKELFDKIMNLIRKRSELKYRTLTKTDLEARRSNAYRYSI